MRSSDHLSKFQINVCKGQAMVSPSPQPSFLQPPLL
uniref:Uncharacterized protein n=1 Tax=Rhizophora mucronata TaxID=61149 RepID=A0A2P2KN42_RHIMU